MPYTQWEAISIIVMAIMENTALARFARNRISSTTYYYNFKVLCIYKAEYDSPCLQWQILGETIAMLNYGNQLL